VEDPLLEVPATVVAYDDDYFVADLAQEDADRVVLRIPL
jgi:hypothetical protein